MIYGMHGSPASGKERDTLAMTAQNGNRIRMGISQQRSLGTPLKLAQEVWGGHIAKRTRKSPASDKICVGYEWRLSHIASLRFFDDIRPYMIIPYKKVQLAAAIKRSRVKADHSYSCAFCEETFGYASNRRRHERTHHLEKDSCFTCDGCSKPYKTRDSLTRHKRQSHKTNVSGSSEPQDTSLQETP
jgi:hypothetical protein